jgi:hypothetical protein
MKNIYTYLALCLLSTTLFAQNAVNSVETKYRRSSLYTLMITDPTRTYESTINEYFSTKLIPNKFNEHNLTERFINRKLGNEDQLENNNQFLIQNKIAKKLVSKWFKRSEKGGFSMELIKERGFYDASISDVNKAKLNTRGMALLSDAGEELISNTFVLINDSRYLNKEDMGKVANGAISLVSNKLGFLGSLAAKALVKTVAKGYLVSTTSYLYKLVWNQETATRFYNELWADDKTITSKLKTDFENADFFKLEFIGSDKSMADVQSTSFTNKTDAELIGSATLKSIDNVIINLQKTHDVFKTKTPIFTTDPVTAKIGLKEGIDKKTKFEVLEQQIDENGKTKYKSVGTLKVDTDYPIWDNQYGANEEKKDQQTDKTYFKINSGKGFYPGMLMRQIK